MHKSVLKKSNSSDVSCVEGISKRAAKNDVSATELDVEFYREIYEDIRQYNAEEIKKHWVNQGYKEKRYPNEQIAYSVALQHDDVPIDFDADNYADLNQDLLETCKWKHELVFHYIYQGRKEGRNYKAYSEQQAIIIRDRCMKLDLSFYRSHYEDLKHMSDDELRAHWSFQGELEGRLQNSDEALERFTRASELPTDFDVDEYIRINEDIKNTFVYKYEAINHYLNTGIFEKRTYKEETINQHENIPSTTLRHNSEICLDIEFYTEFYTDLTELDEKGAIKHWLEKGRSEGRAMSVSDLASKDTRYQLLPKYFNVPTYMVLNKDLTDAFKSNWEFEYHYINNGILEKRVYRSKNIDKNFIEEYYDLRLEKAVTHDRVIRELRRCTEKNKYFYLNESELALSHGIDGYEILLNIFDHEAYAYGNNFKLDDVPRLNRSTCLYHFFQVTLNKCPLISYEYQFDHDFYYREYKSDLHSQINDSDIYIFNSKADQSKKEKLWNDWIFRGIPLGRVPNLRIWVKETFQIDVPSSVVNEIEKYFLANSIDIGDERPSKVIEHYMYKGLFENRVGVTYCAENNKFHCCVADLLARQGNKKEAVRIYEYVLDVTSYYPHALHHLADSFLECRFYRQAAYVYEELVRNDDALEWVYLNLAESYKHLNYYQRAAEVLTLGTRKFPADVYINEQSEILNDENLKKSRIIAKKYAAYGNIATGQKLVNRALNQFPKKSIVAPLNSDSRSIAIVANQDLEQCRFYRVDQKVCHLTNAGYIVDVYAYNEPLDAYFDQLNKYHTVIFYRVPALKSVIDAINAANSHGIPTIYDIDDLIFDTAYFPPSFDTYAEQITQDIYQSLCIDVPLLEYAMRLCQYGLASTPALAEYMRPFIMSGQVFIHRNAMSPLHSCFAKLLPDNKNSDIVTVFYGSGTKAHKDDFQRILQPAMVKLHKLHGERVRFIIVGHISMNDDLASMGSQLVLLEPITDIEQYWTLMRDEVDINLAVLSKTPVTNVKSEIKWLEAAMMGIPSVVSDTTTYLEVVEQGKTGFICSNSDEFYEKTNSLIEDRDLRTAMGVAAHHYVLEKYSIENQSNNIDKIVSSLRPKKDPEKLRIAIVNVFYPPQSIGGATRVVVNNVNELKSRFGDEIAIQVFCSNTGKDAYKNNIHSYMGVKVTSVNCPGIPDIDHSISDRNMGEAFTKFLNDFHPDIVHFHCIQRLTESVVRVTRRQNIPYIITAHDGWWISDHQFLLDSNDNIKLYDYSKSVVTAVKQGNERASILRKELQGASAVLTVSHSFAKLYRKAGLRNIQVVENGVSPLNFPKKIPSSTGKVRLAHIGGKERHKGLQVLKNAIMQNSGLHWLELLVIDHSAAPGTRYTENWKGVEVTFVPKVDQNKIDDLYSSIDVLVAPSVWPESYGLVTREAIVCGCWVIASNRGAIGSDVAVGKNGFIVNVDSPYALLEVLEQIDNDPEKYRNVPDYEPDLRESKDQAADLYTIYKSIVNESANSVACT